MIKAIAEQSPAVLLGGITGGLAGAVAVFFTWLSDARSRTLREFLLQGLEVHKLREAYVLAGDNFANVALEDNRNRKVESSNALHLRQVEVRAVLDQPVWNSAAQPCFGFVEGRRAWIVRNKVLPGELSYDDDAGYPQPVHPALLSSQAMEELCGWIERLASVNRVMFLSKHARQALWPLLVCVAGEDRIAVFGSRLTKRATKFLRWYRKKYGTRRAC
jgi:hypothetical protein